MHRQIITPNPNREIQHSSAHTLRLGKVEIARKEEERVAVSERTSTKQTRKASIPQRRKRTSPIRNSPQDKSNRDKSNRQWWPSEYTIPNRQYTASRTIKQHPRGIQPRTDEINKLTEQSNRNRLPSTPSWPSTSCRTTWSSPIFAQLGVEQCSLTTLATALHIGCRSRSVLLLLHLLHSIRLVKS